jgi:hypothetical protein
VTRKFIFVNPFNRDAVVKNIDQANEKFLYFIKSNEEEKLKLIYFMNKEEYKEMFNCIEEKKNYVTQPITCIGII